MAGKLSKILVPLLAGGYLAAWVWNEPGLPEDRLRILTPVLLAGSCVVLVWIILVTRNSKPLGFFNYLSSVAVLSTLIPEALKQPAGRGPGATEILWLIGEGCVLLFSAISLAGQTMPRYLPWGGWLFHVLTLSVLAYFVFVFRLF